MSEGASLDDLRRLYEERYADYLRVATALTGSLESGRDAVHDGFVGVVRARDSFRGEGPLPGWVWRSVVNAALKRRRNDTAGRPAARCDQRSYGSHRGIRGGAPSTRGPRSLRYPSGNGSFCFCATTQTSTTSRSRPRSRPAPARSARLCTQHTLHYDVPSRRFH